MVLQPAVLGTGWLGAWRQTCLQVVHAGIHELAPGAVVQRRRREHWSWYAVLDGALVLQQGARRWSLAAGDALPLPPGAAFRELAGRGPAGTGVAVRVSVVDFALLPALGAADPFQAIAAAAVPQRLPLPRLRAAAQELAALQAQVEHGEPLAALAWRPRFEELLVSWLRAHLAVALPADALPAPPAWLAELRHLAAHRLRGAATRVGALAARAGCSASHLAHLWRRHFGAGVLAVIKRDRLEIAARLLVADPARGVGEVARFCGWRDHRRFGRDFSARYGAPPARWRSGAGQAAARGIPSPTVRRRAR